MAGKRRRSNSRADDGAAGEHEDEDAAAPVGPTASVSEVQQQDFQPNPSKHKERAIPQYGGPQANAAAASQINPGDAGSLGRAPLIRNDHLDPRGPAERQTSGDTGEGANHADHPFANGFQGATDGLDMDAYDHNDGFLASNSDDSNDDDNGDDVDDHGDDDDDESQR